MAWKKRLNASLSHSHHLGEAGRNLRPEIDANMPPIACAENATPCFFAAAARPSVKALVVAPSFS